MTFAVGGSAKIAVLDHTYDTTILETYNPYFCCETDGDISCSGVNIEGTTLRREVELLYSMWWTQLLLAIFDGLPSVAKLPSHIYLEV